MQQLATQRPATTIEGSMTFVVNDGVRPATYPEEMTPTGARMTGTYVQQMVRIEDARPIRNTLSLDVQGYLLTDHTSAVTDFYDEDQLRRICYPECIALVQRFTGAKKVIIFDHTIRVEDQAKRAKLDMRAPVYSVHNDYTDWSAPKRVRDLLPPDEAEEMLRHRYLMVNVWRPIVGPVESMPLVLCDARTMAPEDQIAADHIYSNRRGETLRIAYNPAQRWNYFSRMQTNEAVLLKCFDSKTDGRARWSGHGAATLTTPRPAGAPPRESIEIRTIAFLVPE